jgi:hypothetical protein
VKSALLACLTGTALLAAGRDEDQLLDRLRTRVNEMLARAPKYTCSLVITREYHEPTLTRLPHSCAELLSWKEAHTYGLTHYSTNRLKLEVTVVEGREVFSWAGAARFEERDLADMLSEGPIGTGGFAGFLSNLFDGRSAAFTYSGEVHRNGRTLAEFAYRVPTASSNHYFRAGGKNWAVVAYEGKVLVDRDSADLAHLTVEVKQPPAASHNCLTSTQLQYTRVPMAGGDFLLPAEVNQRFISTLGNEAENTTRYSSCREFQSESVVTFGRPPAGPRPATGATAPIRPPANRLVMLELARAIDTTTASAGDFFTGRVVQAIRDTRGRELVPAGALIQGHLTRVQRYHLASQTTVVFQPEYVVADAGRVAIALLPRSHREYMWATAGTLDKPVRWRAASTGEVPYRNEHNLGVYHFLGTEVTIPIGFRTEWVTGNP